MKNKTIKKINTFGKVGYIICMTGKIAMMIATIACLVGANTPATVTSTVYISSYKWILFVGVLGCLTVWVVFYFAEKLCQSFKDCETPFTEEVSSGLAKLAYSLIGMGVVDMFSESGIDSFMVNQFLIDADINMVTVLLILCVFTLSFIFKHGAALQAESDETL